MAVLSEPLPVRLTLVDLKVGKERVGTAPRFYNRGHSNKPDFGAIPSLRFRKSGFISIGYSRLVNKRSYEPASPSLGMDPAFGLHVGSDARLRPG